MDEELGELTKEVRELGKGVDALRNEVTGFLRLGRDPARLHQVGGGVLRGHPGRARGGGGQRGVERLGPALNSEVKTQGSRLDKIDGRPDGIAKQLEVLIRQTTPKRAARHRRQVQRGPPN